MAPLVKCLCSFFLCGFARIWISVGRPRANANGFSASLTDIWPAQSLNWVMKTVYANSKNALVDSFRERQQR